MILAQKRIPLATPTMHEEEMGFIQEAFEKNWIAPLGFNCDNFEKEMAEYITSLKMCAFVCDYDHNAPDPEYLRNTHYKMYEKIRAKHPDIPYFMVTKPDFAYRDEDFERRCVIMESYLKAYRSGDKNVYFIDGSAFFNGVDIGDYTVDCCHPTDDGFVRMANYIGDVLAKVMDL